MKLSTITGKLPDDYQFKPSPLLVLPSCKVGVEVELERVEYGLQTNLRRSKYWNSVADGSLRPIEGIDSREFVLKQGFFGEDLVKALDELEQAIEANKLKPIHSIRTSTHVHIDVREFDVDSLMNLIYIYIIFEKALFRYDGTGREYNHFCIPLYESDGYLEKYAKYVKSKSRDKIKHLLNSFCKYGSLNISSVFKFGTVEFRLLHSTWDKERLLEWINILQSIKKYATHIDNVLEFPYHISIEGVENFTKKVFGDELGEKLFYPELERDVYGGIRFAQDFIYAEENEKTRDALMYDDLSDDKGKLAVLYEKNMKEKEKPDKMEKIKIRKHMPMAPGVHLHAEQIRAMFDEEIIAKNVAPEIVLQGGDAPAAPPGMVFNPAAMEALRNNAMEALRNVPPQPDGEGGIN